MRIERRWLIRMAIALALAMLIIAVFLLGVFVGELHRARSVRDGGTPPGTEPFMGEPLRPPWPPGTWFDFRRHEGKHGARGVVNEVKEGVIVITTHRNTELQIIVTEKTVFKRARVRITLADVHSGDRIAVIGEPRGEGKIEAKVVWVIPFR